MSSTATATTPPFADQPAGLPFVRYGRTSKLGGRDAGDNLSRSDQFRDVDAIAARYSLPTLPEDFYDGDQSGKSLVRPEWERAIAMVRDGRAAGIIACNFKRLGRAKTAEMLLMVEDVESVGGRLYTDSGPVSVDDADDELMTTVHAMIARREWRERRKYLMDSVDNAIGRGVHLSAPFGYAKPDGKRGSALVVNDAERPAVEAAFAARAAGKSWAAAADAMNATGVKPRPYKRHGVELQAAGFTHKTARWIVTNRVYTGVAYNGDREHVDAHAAIVSPELFALANRSRGVKPKGPSAGYMLSGLVRCASCGYVMTHAGESYRCRAAQHGDGRCAEPANVPAAALHAYVADQFAARYCDMEMEGIVDDAGVMAAEAAVAQCKRKVGGLMALADTLGDMDRDERAEYDDQMRAARAALKEARRELDDAQASARGADLPAGLDADGFNDAPVQDQRLFLSTVFAGVVVRRARRWREPVADRVRIISRDDAPANSTAMLAFTRTLDW